MNHFYALRLWRWNGQQVPKRLHQKLRRREITQKTIQHLLPSPPPPPEKKEKKKDKETLPLTPNVILSLINPVRAPVTYCSDICQYYCHWHFLPWKTRDHEFYFKINSLRCDIFHFPYFPRNSVTVTSLSCGNCDHHLFLYILNTS